MGIQLVHNENIVIFRVLGNHRLNMFYQVRSFLAGRIMGGKDFFQRERPQLLFFLVTNPIVDYDDCAKDFPKQG